MLIRYGTENHLSLCDYQEVICLAAPALKDDAVELLKHTTARGGEQDILPVIAMYGANAAGKSNMIDALRFLFYAASDSYHAWNRRKNFPHLYCEVDGEGKKRPSSYDCDIVINGTHYNYGFSITSIGIEQEWLYAYTAGPKRVLFERNFSNKENAIINLGRSMGHKDTSLRKLAESRKYLFLSAAKYIKHDTLGPIADFFENQFALISGSNNRPDELIADDLSTPEVKRKVETILSKADFGIESIQITSKKIDDKQKDLGKKISEFLKDITGTDEGPTFPEETRSLNFIHKRSDGTTFKVPKSRESSGTIHLLSLLAPIISALKYGKLVVLDEITTSLHTNLSREIINLFSSKESNPNNAQLIFSTHDTNLLSCGVLRRDSIWFAEKDRDGKTCVYPLTDFKVRKGENIEKGYLQGRFGAIPFIGDIRYMFLEES